MILLKLVKRNSFREIKEDHAERGMKAQSNLFEGDMLYNGHLAIADSFDRTSRIYVIQLSHIFEISSILNDKSSISIEILGILNQKC